MNAGDFDDFGPLVERANGRTRDTFPRAIPPRRPAAADRHLHEAVRASRLRRRRLARAQADPIPELIQLAIILLVFATVAALIIL